VVFVADPSRCSGSATLVPRAEPAERAALRQDAPSPRRPRGTLESRLPTADEVGPQWLITEEEGTTDMDLVQRYMGMVEIQARHYGRSRGSATEVCTIELWRFADASQAVAAEGKVFAGWSFEARGVLLVTLRGVRFTRGQPLRKGLFPACHELGELVEGMNE
jgi:hypothetical protein